MKTFYKILVGLLVFFCVAVIVTSFLQKIIYFSLFIGIPAGIAAALTALIFLIKKS